MAEQVSAEILDATVKIEYAGEPAFRIRVPVSIVVRPGADPVVVVTFAESLSFARAGSIAALTRSGAVDVVASISSPSEGLLLGDWSMSLDVVRRTFRMASVGNKILAFPKDRAPAMNHLPTMPCPECGARKAADPAWWCPDCHDTGLVVPPPLTPDEVAALPDGTRVVGDIAVPGLRETGRRFTGAWEAAAGWVFAHFDGPPWTGQYGPDECRVWLADDGGDESSDG